MALNARPRFPCPLCGTHLDLRESRANKPYCVCNACGVQIFFRGRQGISRLRAILEEDKSLSVGHSAAATPALAVFTRLEELRGHNKALQDRRPLIFADEDLDNAIAAITMEIDHLRALLAEMSGRGAIQPIIAPCP